MARANPAARYTRRRRRNPSSLGSTKGLFTGAVFVAAGVVGSQFAAGFIPVLPFGRWGVLAAKSGIAIGLGIAAKRFGVSQANATLVTLGGLAGVVQDLFAVARSKFPDIFQERAVQLPTPMPMPVASQPAGIAQPSNDVYGDGSMNDLVMWRRQNGMWGGSGMGDVVLYGRR